MGVFDKIAGVFVEKTDSHKKKNPSWILRSPS